MQVVAGEAFSADKDREVGFVWGNEEWFKMTEILEMKDVQRKGSPRQQIK